MNLNKKKYRVYKLETNSSVIVPYQRMIVLDVSFWDDKVEHEIYPVIALRHKRVSFYNKTTDDYDSYANHKELVEAGYELGLDIWETVPLIAGDFGNCRTEIIDIYDEDFAREGAEFQLIVPTWTPEQDADKVRPFVDTIGEKLRKRFTHKNLDVVS